MPSGQVLYTNAFDSDVHADLRFRYSRNLLEQDVILRERPALPEGMSAENLRLEVWTEWFDSVPAARRTQMIDLRRSQDDEAPALASDDEADFLSAKIGGGSAFSTGEPDDKFPVAKTWARVEGRDWLIETVDYRAMKAKFDALGGSGRKRTAKAGSSQEELIRLLAVRAGNGAPISDPASSLIESAERAGSETGAPSLLLAQANPPETPGVVVDFAIIACVPVPPGVISWWPAGGNAKDAIAASGNDGTLFNTAAYVAGLVGQGFVFNGLYSEDYAEIANTPSLNPPNGLTVEAWIYFTSESSGANMPIVSKDGGNGRQYLLTKTENDGIRAHVGIEGGAFYYTDGQIVLAPDTWHHVAMTYSAADSALAIYVDGELDVAAQVSGSLLTSSEPLYLGGAPYWGYYWDGGIDEASVYDRALSEEEIGLIYEAGAAGKINPNCVAEPNDLAAWFPGDTHAHDVHTGNAAALQNGTGYAPAVASHGFKFDGVNDGVTMTDANAAALNFAAGQDFSVEVWLKADVHSTTYGVEAVLGKRHSPNSSTALGWELFLINGRPGLQLADSSGPANYIIPSGDLRNTGWRHVVVTVDRDSTTGVRFYVDGLEVVQFNPTGKAGNLSSTAAPLRIGVHPQPGLNCFYKGIIDEATVYRRALSGTEISALYQAGSAGKCKTDVDSDFMEDWWELRHFGNLDRTGTADYDGDDIDDAAEFAGHSNPNSLTFDAHYASTQIRNPVVSGNCSVHTGVPVQMAVLKDSTNLAAAAWLDYNPNFTATLTNVDGKHTIMVALRGRVPDYPPVWDLTRFTLDRVPPILVITNPTVATVTQPVLQLRGHANEQLANISYDVESANSQLTDQMGFVVGKVFEAARADFTTNFFHCYDIPLGNGNNLITLRAADLAGNTIVLTTNIVLDYSIVTTGPVIKLIWPQDGMHLSGERFYVRGTVDDPTAQIAVRIVAAGGSTTQISGLVERDGMYWLEDLSLLPGATQLQITATNAAGRTSVTNLSVLRSDVTLVIDSTLQDQSLYQARGDIQGRVAPGYAVTVNGKSATVDASGNWTAEKVPIHGKGTATFDAVAVSIGSPASPSVNVSEEIEMPPMIAVVEHHMGQTWHYWETEYPWDALYVETKEYTAGFHPLPDGTWSQTYSGKFTYDSAITEYPHVWGTVTWSDSNPNGNLHSFMDDPPLPLYEYNGPTSYDRYAWSVPQENLSLANTGGTPHPQYYYIHHYGGEGVHHHWDIGTEHIDLTAYAPRTHVRLYTGGKSGSNRKNLFHIQAGATEYGKPNPTYAWHLTPETNIPPSEFLVFGKHPNNEGSMWVLLRDNIEADATVYAFVKHYNAGTWAQKYPEVDLDIDSDNDGVIEPNDEEEDAIEEKAPGKLITVNNGDADGDGIPDFADGYNKFGTTDQAGQSAPFTPLILDLPSGISWERAKVRFSYSASPPAGVTETANPDGSKTYTPAPGGLRLWSADGTQFRKKEGIDFYNREGEFPIQDGHYVASTVYYVSNLTALYAEGIQPGTYTVTVELDPDGESGFITKDTVVVTVLETALVRVDENNNAWKTTTLEVSHPSPTINLSACTVSGVLSPGPDYQHLQGQLNVAGIVKSAVCDIYPDDNNDIDEVRIFVNDLETPVATVSLTKSKTENPQSLARPFDYMGSFSQQLNIALEYGPNLVRVEATDQIFGIKGYTEYIVDVTGQPPIVLPTAVPAEQEWMSYEGWTFPGDTGTGAYQGALAKQSNGGVFKPYVIEFIGAEALLQDLQSVNFNGVEHRLRRYGNRVFLGLKQQAAIQSEIATVLLGVAADYTEIHQSRDQFSLDYYQGFSLGFCEGGVYLVGDLGTLAVKTSPVTMIWRFAQGDFLTEERQFLLNTYKAAQQLVAFWDEWNDRTVEQIMTEDPQADPAEVALAAVSEDFRVLGEATKHIIVSVGEKLQQMDSFDRGRVEGRIGFEVVTLLIAEVKVGQAAKVTKVKEIGLVENIATRVEQAVDAGKLAKGDAALGQKLKEAMQAARLRIRQFSTTGRYADLPTLPEYARNHLNQAAAFESELAGQSFIPRADGVCHYLKGPFVNQSRWAGSGHWRFHSKMEEFWRPYRKNGALYGQRPTCGQYSDALSEALTHSGVPPEEVEHLLTLARNDRMTLRTRPDGSQFRLLDSDLVPKIPRPVPLAPPPG